MMLMKNEVLGIRCELETCQHEMLGDEVSISLNGNNVIVNKNNLGFLEPREKFACIGESPVFLKSESLVGIIGPTKTSEFLLKVNSRGYLHEFLVPEEDVIFLK